MPDAMDSPMGSRGERKWVEELESGPSDASFERWFDGLAPGERLGVLTTVISRCTPQELSFVSDACASRKSSGVFDRLVRDPTPHGPHAPPHVPHAVPHVVPHSPHVPAAPAPQPVSGNPPHASAGSAAPLRLGGSPLRPYIGKQDHFSQAFLRPSSFNPWPLSQEIVRPKSATDWWPTKPHPQPIGRPKDEKHHSDSEESRTTKKFPPSSPAPSSGSSSHSAQRAVNFMDPELLSDIGAWLRSLRLHKYTGNLAGMKWQDVIQLNDKQLEARGVNALGARRKMLKMFEEIRAAQEEGKLPK